MSPEPPGFKRRRNDDDEQNPIYFFPTETEDDTVLPIPFEPEQPGPIVLKRASEEREWPPEVTFPRSLLFLVFAVAVGALTVGLVSLMQGRRLLTNVAVNAPPPTSAGAAAPSIASPSSSSSPGTAVDAAPTAAPTAGDVTAAPRGSEPAAAGARRVMDAAILPSGDGVPSGAAAAAPDEVAALPQFDTPQNGLPELPLTTSIDLPRPEAPPMAARATPPAAPLDAGPSLARAPIARPVVDDREIIERLLLDYRDAYTRLDSASAATIWPTVDTRALSRAFSTISQQEVRFERCSLKLDDQQASALCIGEIEYVQRTGDQSLKRRNLSWNFDFVRRSDRWEISNVDAR